jgi:hypothetical protein
VLAGYDEQGGWYGANPPLPLEPPAHGLSLIVDAVTDASVAFTSLFYAAWTLNAGINLAGTGCTPEAPTAGALITELGDHAGKIAFQRFDQRTGRHEALVRQPDGTLVGTDFPIQAGEGYRLSIDAAVTDCRP